jgi:hypothetical protein
MNQNSAPAAPAVKGDHMSARLTPLQELDQATGEPITHIVIGEWGWGEFDDEHESFDIIPADRRNVLMTREEAEPFLSKHSFSFYGGYGSPECFAIYAWTENYVLWITQYDGSTGINRAPRNPISVQPSMPGG